MKIKIEMDLPRWLSRLILVGIPVAIIAIGAWVYAGVPNTFTAGDKLTAQKLNDNFAAVATPSGTVAAFAGPVTPVQWLLCDGSAVSRTTYAALFAAIGTTHGSGDGATTFNLPDYRGRFLRGVDNGAGRDPDAAKRTAMAPNGNLGDIVGSVQGGDVGPHTHAEGIWIGCAGVGSNWGPNGPVKFADNGCSGNNQPWGGYTFSNGGSESRPVNASVNYIIKC